MEKTYLLFPSMYLLQIASQLGMRYFIHFSCLLGICLVWACADIACAAIVSEFSGASFLLCRDETEFWGNHCFQAFKVLLSPLPLVFLSLEGRTFIKMLHLGLNVSVSHSLLIFQLWISLLITMCYRQKLLWWEVSHTLLYGCTNSPLGDILLKCSISGIIAV